MDISLKVINEFYDKLEIKVIKKLGSKIKFSYNNDAFKYIKKHGSLKNKKTEILNNLFTFYTCAYFETNDCDSNFIYKMTSKDKQKSKVCFYVSTINEACKKYLFFVLMRYEIIPNNSYFYEYENLKLMFYDQKITIDECIVNKQLGKYRKKEEEEKVALFCKYIPVKIKYHLYDKVDIHSSLSLITDDRGADDYYSNNHDPEFKKIIDLDYYFNHTLQYEHILDGKHTYNNIYYNNLQNADIGKTVDHHTQDTFPELTKISETRLTERYQYFDLGKFLVISEEIENKYCCTFKSFTDPILHASFSSTVEITNEISTTIPTNVVGIDKVFIQYIDSKSNKNKIYVKTKYFAISVL